MHHKDKIRIETNGRTINGNGEIKVKIKPKKI